jgi:hypothetical protein
MTLNIDQPINLENSHDLMFKIIISQSLHAITHYMKSHGEREMMSGRIFDKA